MTSTYEPTYLAFAVPDDEFFADLRVGLTRRDASYGLVIAAMVVGLIVSNHRRERGVRRSEERLTALLSNANDLILVLDRHGAPERIDYAVERYTKEAQRLLGVLDTRLKGREYIAGGEYSIADMAAYPWINVYESAPLDLEPWPELRRWQASIAARPATQRAYALSKQVNPDAGKPMSDEEKALLFGQGPKRD